MSDAPLTDAELIEAGVISFRAPSEIARALRAARAAGYEAATRDAVAFFREKMGLFERTGYGFAEAMFETAIHQLERREHVGAGDAK